MSFVFNDANTQQMSMMDGYNTLTEREKKFLSNSWAQYFADHIFPKIDEAPYAVLYSTRDSRPNTPVNVQIGALILKEFMGFSDDDLLASLLFDIRFQYALHTTSFLEQPLNDRTLGRFRERCTAYEKETGIDLLHNTIESLADEMASMMKLDRSLRRMDSLMVRSNIKRMSRLELLYTCVSNLAKEMKKQNFDLPDQLFHYTQDNDRNLVIYHNRSDDTAEKIQVVLKDALLIKELCGSDYDESSSYQLLLRVIREQTVLQEDGSLRLREKEDGGMNAEILQNPSDPDATFREKAGKQNRGYVANVTEITGDAGSIVIDYQYEKNTYSDSQFMKDAIKKMDTQNGSVMVVTDGAYAGSENETLAKEKNIQLTATNLTGRETNDIFADFEFSEDGKKLIHCAGGFEPKSCSYSEQTNQCTVSFQKSQCESCPYQKQCRPKMFKRVSRKVVSQTSKKRAEQQRERGTEEFHQYSRFRNGVETIPSILRRKYGIDHMPVRGKIKSGFFLGCKIGALNFKKFCKYMQSLGPCTQNMQTA